MKNIFNSNATYLTQFSSYLHEILHEHALITLFSRPGLLWSLKVIQCLRKTKNVKIGYKIADCGEEEEQLVFCFLAWGN